MTRALSSPVTATEHAFVGSDLWTAGARTAMTDAVFSELHKIHKLEDTHSGQILNTYSGIKSKTRLRPNVVADHTAALHFFGVGGLRGMQPPTAQQVAASKLLSKSTGKILLPPSDKDRSFPVWDNYATPVLSRGIPQYQARNDLYASGFFSSKIPPRSQRMRKSASTGSRSSGRPQSAASSRPSRPQSAKPAVGGGGAAPAASSYSVDRLDVSPQSSATAMHLLGGEGNKQRTLLFDQPTSPTSILDANFLRSLDEISVTRPVSRASTSRPSSAKPAPKMTRPRTASPVSYRRPSQQQEPPKRREAPIASPPQPPPKLHYARVVSSVNEKNDPLPVYGLRPL